MEIKITAPKVVYTLTLERTMSVIRGESGTGKTLLLNLVYDYTRYLDKSFVKVESKLPVVVVREAPYSVDSWVAKYGGYIVFIDEDVEYRDYKESVFLTAAKNAGCWLVLVTREDTGFECAISSVYTLHESGRYRTTVQAMPMRKYNPSQNYPG